MVKPIMAAIIVIPLAFCVAAYAHGDAEWIMREPSYLAANGSHCCGPQDCQQLPAGAAEPVEGGWRVIETGQIFKWGERGLYPNARDGVTLWGCRFPGVPYRCLFVPSHGG